jgi:hypothetical protein
MKTRVLAQEVILSYFPDLLSPDVSGLSLIFQTQIMLLQTQAYLNILLMAFSKDFDVFG